jgi:predicted aspartyl protease
VAAVVVGPNGRADVQLVLDTDAVLTTLVPRIAEAIGYTSAARVARSVVRSAVAEEHGYVVRLAALSTLGFAVPDVHADIADLGHGIDGVLGMNVLGDFNFEIRPAERRILVERIASS